MGGSGADAGQPCPAGHAGPGYRLVRYGTAATAAGRRQVWQCVAPDGTAHTFRGELLEPPVLPAVDEPGVPRVRCPQPAHRDARVRSRGTRTTGTGTWRRFECVCPDGSRHSFVIGVDAAPPRPPSPPPPDCPEHPDSRVTRAGTYGRRSRRQRYLCTPPHAKAHQFTPPLAREVVVDGAACVRCDELLSPHHGPIAAARHATWTLVGVAQALNDLSLGSSYASVSVALRAQRDAAREHLQVAHGLPGSSPRAPAPVRGSRAERRSAWRVAADLVEQYSPPLFAEVDAANRAHAQAVRDANDATLAADPAAVLDAPLVYVLDEHPVVSTAGGTRRQAWSVLTVVEVRWRQPAGLTGAPVREGRLRVARAMPRANADAWQLVLDELGARPDVVVADDGPAIQAALRRVYGAQVTVVPSLWHLHGNVRDALLELPGAVFLDGSERVLVDPLRAHLSALARDELVLRDAAGVIAWWEELEALVAALPAPVAAVRALRDQHEPRLLAALDVLASSPQVPGSNAAVEASIRMVIGPFLENRAHAFSNAERTNRLLNLLVCRDAGMFTDLDALALRIRRMNEAAGGWAPPPRQILDRQPPGLPAGAGRYGSLTSHATVVRLAAARGVTTAAQAAGSAPVPLLSRQTPQARQSAPIREWARSVGLPGGVSGPLRASVRAAWQARVDGASDEQAREVFEREEAGRLARQQQARQGRWTAAAERARRDELAPVRAWAQASGIALPANNRIPTAVMDAYQAHLEGRSLRPSEQARVAGSSSRRAGQAPPSKPPGRGPGAAAQGRAGRAPASKPASKRAAERAPEPAPGRAREPAAEPASGRAPRAASPGGGAGGAS